MVKKKLNKSPKSNSTRSSIPCLVVIGFGPFEDILRNPSGDLAETLHLQTILGILIIGQNIDVSWQTAWASIQNVIHQYNPIGVLCLGVAPDPYIRLEILAKNAACPREDVSGEKPELFDMLQIIPDAPDAYRTTLPIEWLAKRMNDRYEKMLSQGKDKSTIIQAGRSLDAGHYLCNFAFFNLMHYLKNTVPFRGFIHIPPYPSDNTPSPFTSEEIISSGSYLVEEFAKWIAQKNLKKILRKKMTV